MKYVWDFTTFSNCSMLQPSTHHDPILFSKSSSYIIHLSYPFPTTRPIFSFQLQSFEDFEFPFGEQILDLSPPNWHHSSTHLTSFISLEHNIFGQFGVPESILFFTQIFCSVNRRSDRPKTLGRCSEQLKQHLDPLLVTFQAWAFFLYLFTLSIVIFCNVLGIATLLEGEMWEFVRLGVSAR